MAIGTLESGKNIDTTTGQVVNPQVYYNDANGKPVYTPYGGTVGNPANANGTPQQPRPILNEYQNAQAEYYNNLNRQKPDENAIRQQVLQQQQARIDAINRVYDDELGKARITAQGRLGETRALGAARGVLGSEFGQQEKAGTQQVNQQQEDAVQNQRQREITDVLDRVDTISKERYQAELQQVDKNNAEYLNFLGNKQNEARDTVLNLAKAGKSLEELNKDQYKSIIDATGYDPIQFDAIYNASKPKAQQVKYDYKELKDGTLLRTGDDGTVKEMGNHAPPDDTGDWKIQQFDDGTVAWINAKTKAFEVIGDKGQYAKPAAVKTVKTNSNNSNTTSISPSSYDVIKANLEKSKGTDGFVNTDVYKKERLQAKDKTTFDKNFSYLLNPKDSSTKEILDKKTDRYTSRDIPADLYKEILSNIKEGANINDVLSTYNDVDPSFISTLYKVNE